MRKVHHPRSCSDPIVDGLWVCEDCERDRESTTPIGINSPVESFEVAELSGETTVSGDVLRCVGTPKDDAERLSSGVEISDLRSTQIIQPMRAQGRIARASLAPSTIERSLRIDSLIRWSKETQLLIDREATMAP